MKRWVTVPAFISKTAVPPMGEVPSTAATPVTYFAMAVNANSTLRPLFALVSIKGTPYSCGTRHTGVTNITRGVPGGSRLVPSPGRHWCLRQELTPRAGRGALPRWAGEAERGFTAQAFLTQLWK